MSVNLVAVTASAGVPLFTRNICLNKPNEECIPFATLAALNGVNLFSRLNAYNLMSASTKDTKIWWKLYKGSIVLILISTTDIESTFSHASDETLNSLLDLIFDTALFHCSLNEIISQNTERLKRSLKHAFSSFDYILKLAFSGKSLSLWTHKVNYQFVDCQHTVFLESLLDSVCQVGNSAFGCILINKRVVVATKQWWTKLAPTKDAFLVTLVVNSLSTHEIQRPTEFTVFLPDNCPDSKTRLIVTSLYKNVTLLILCGDLPSLEFLVKQGIQPLKESKVNFDCFMKLFQSEYKLNVPLDEKVIGFVFIHQNLRVVTKFGNFDDNKIRDIIKFIEYSSIQKKPLKNWQSFFVFRDYKCFAISQIQQMFVLFPNDTTNAQMKEIALRTFTKINKDKRLWP